MPFSTKLLAEIFFFLARAILLTFLYKRIGNYMKIYLSKNISNFSTIIYHRIFFKYSYQDSIIRHNQHLLPNYINTIVYYLNINEAYI